MFIHIQSDRTGVGTVALSVTALLCVFGSATACGSETESGEPPGVLHEEQTAMPSTNSPTAGQGAPDGGAVQSEVVCGRGISGIVCASSNGTSFGPVSTWQSVFSDANGWNQVQYYSTIRLPDINGDGKADVCGRGPAGIVCALSNGTSFATLSTWQPVFSDANGWNAAQYYSTIRFPDINGDGKADVCGRGIGGIDCALSNGTSFGTFATWQSDFSNAHGWNAPQYYSTIAFADINSDGKADVCGRGIAGIECAVSNGTSFGTPATWQPGFSDANGWNAVQYYSTIRFPDINADGKADVCGRGPDGIDCAVSNGTSFGTRSTWQSSFSDANRWNAAQYYSTIQYARE